MDLGYRHLLKRAFVDSLVARNRKAVLVMPVWKLGVMKPFNCREAVLRLCEEVVLFLHRECRTSNMFKKPGGIDPKFRFRGLFQKAQE
jgi:hypothetical protein